MIILALNELFFPIFQSALTRLRGLTFGHQMLGGDPVEDDVGVDVEEVHAARLQLQRRLVRATARDVDDARVGHHVVGQNAAQHLKLRKNEQK